MGFEYTAVGDAALTQFTTGNESDLFSLFGRAGFHTVVVQDFVLLLCVLYVCQVVYSV